MSTSVVDVPREAREFDEDAALEILISMAEQTMNEADSPRAKKFWFKRMQHFIKDRSASQISKMERERRLA